MIEAVQFLWLAWGAYRQARRQPNVTIYSAITRHGVPHVCIFVGVGREAWRVSQRAIEEFR